MEGFIRSLGIVVLHEEIKQRVILLLDELGHASLDISQVTADLGKKFLELF